MNSHETIQRKTCPTHNSIMAGIFGRQLAKDEVVHQINRDKQDNCTKNLQVYTRAEHARLRTTGRVCFQAHKIATHWLDRSTPSAHHLAGVISQQAAENGRQIYQI